MSIRCTSRLLKRLRENPIEDLPGPTNRLGDWYANVLNIGHHRLVIATSERTLLSVIVPIKDSPRLRERIQEAVRNLLIRLDVPVDLAEKEAEGIVGMPFGRTANRSVLGSMNDFSFASKCFFQSGAETVYLEDLEMFLATTPCGPLDISSHPTQRGKPSALLWINFEIQRR